MRFQNTLGLVLALALLTMMLPAALLADTVISTHAPALYGTEDPVPVLYDAATAVPELISAHDGDDYVVTCGDWLARIAYTEYGQANYYPAIVYATNASAALDSSYAFISDTYVIEPGWKLCIPSKAEAESVMSVIDVMNAEYTSEWTESGKAVLEDGTYSEEIVPGSASKIVIALDEHMAFGSADSGESLAFVVLVSQTGGSGTFYELAVLEQQGSDLVHVDSQPLGDRVQVKSLAYADGRVTVEMLTQGADDPMCCPSESVEVMFEYDDQTLKPFEGNQALGAGLDGSSWELVYFVDADGKTVDVLSDAPISLEFAADQMSGQAGCNRYFAAYEIVDDSLALGPIGSTRMACADEIMVQELTFLQALEQLEGYVVEDGVLELQDIDGNTIAVFSETSAAKVMGTVWEWQKLVDSEMNVLVDVANPSKYSLELLDDGTYQVVADCNRASGAYVLEGSDLSLLPGPCTLAACQPDSLYDEYLAHLLSVDTVSLEADSLVLNLEEDGGQMIFWASDLES